MQTERSEVTVPPARRELPTGTLTFMLTDVEGSVALWEDGAVAMRAALARHDALINLVVERYGGQLVRPRGEGDSRFAVFRSATQAVAAAHVLQRMLVAEVCEAQMPPKCFR